MGELVSGNGIPSSSNASFTTGFHHLKRIFSYFIIGAELLFSFDLVLI